MARRAVAAVLLGAMFSPPLAALAGETPDMPVRVEPGPTLRRRLSVSSPIPRQGQRKLLVIQVDFTDSPCRISQATWKERFFGNAGFAEYFGANSYGKLIYSGDVVGAGPSLDSGDARVQPSAFVEASSSGGRTVQAASAGCLHLSESLSFYANDEYGFNTAGACSRRSLPGIVLDALSALDAAGFDFTPYADPETKAVPNIVVLGAARSFDHVGDASKSLLSAASELSSAFSGCQKSLQVSSGGWFVSSAGFSANAFTFCTQHLGSWDEPAGIGDCIHEQGRALGMFDQNQYTGQYSLMGTGFRGSTAQGNDPSHFGAFDKEVFGWIQPEVVGRSSSEVEFLLRPSHLSNDVLKLRIRDSSEYFLVENRQELAWQSPPSLDLAPRFCPGVLIWHIDEAVALEGTYMWDHNLVNDVDAPGGPQHPGVMVKEADADASLLNGNDLECDDTLAVSGGEFSGAKALLWSGVDSQVSLRVLTDANADGAIRIGVRCPTCDGPTATSQSTTFLAPTPPSTTSTLQLATTPSTTPSLTPAPSTTPAPTLAPTTTPALAPAPVPTTSPAATARTTTPALAPTPSATLAPTRAPTTTPTPATAPSTSRAPAPAPSTAPALAPAPSTTRSPTVEPTTTQARAPTPSTTPEPTLAPTTTPTLAPTATPALAPAPSTTRAPAPSTTRSLTLAPTTTAAPAPAPSATRSPTLAPTKTATPAPAPLTTRALTPAPTTRALPTPAPSTTRAPTPAPATPAPAPAPTPAPAPAPCHRHDDDDRFWGWVWSWFGW